MLGSAEISPRSGLRRSLLGLASGQVYPLRHTQWNAKPLGGLMTVLSSSQQRALLRVLKPALVHMRAFASVSSVDGHDGGVTTRHWKAVNALLNAVHNIPDWLEGTSAIPFDEARFVEALRRVDEHFRLLGHELDFNGAWKHASETTTTGSD